MTTKASESAKTASKRARSVARGPKTGKGAPTSGSHGPASGGDSVASNILDSIPQLVPTLLPVDTTPLSAEPTPMSLEISPHAPDELPEDPGANLPMAMYQPQLGGSLPKNLNNLRLPPMKSVGKDANGKVIPHVRSEEVAQAVAELALANTPDNTICAILNLRPGHLKQYYSNELNHTRPIVDARVASSIYALALAGEPGTLKFVAKARMKWRDGDVPGEGASLFNNIHIHVDGGGN